MLADIKGKRVKITERIEMYKGKPEIRINAAEQLEVRMIRSNPCTGLERASVLRGRSAVYTVDLP